VRWPSKNPADYRGEGQPVQITVERWILISLGLLPVVFLSGIWTLTGWTGWPWDPLRLALAISAAVAIATRRKLIWIPLLVAWAAVACPVPLTLRDEGTRQTPPGRVLALGTGEASYDDNTGEQRPDGPLPAVTEHTERLPLGVVWARRRDRNYLNGEGGYTRADLVAVAVGWLPYPHIQRTAVAPLGGSNSDDWRNEDQVELRRDGDRLYFAESSYELKGRKLTGELRRVALAPAPSAITWLGWVLVGGFGLVAAAAARRTVI